MIMNIKKMTIFTGAYVRIKIKPYCIMKDKNGYKIKPKYDIYRQDRYDDYSKYEKTRSYYIIMKRYDNDIIKAEMYDTNVGDITFDMTQLIIETYYSIVSLKSIKHKYSVNEHFEIADMQLLPKKKILCVSAYVYKNLLFEKEGSHKVYIFFTDKGWKKLLKMIFKSIKFKKKNAL